MNKLVFAAVMAAGAFFITPPQGHAENINIGNGTYNFTRQVDRQVAPGVKYTYFLCTGRGAAGTHVYVTEVDLTNPNVKVEYLTANGTMGGSTKTLANIASANTSTNHKVVAGANANFWITSEQPWKSQLSVMPHGTAVSNGTFYSINPRDGQDSHMGGPTTTGSIAIGTDGRAHIKRFFFHNCIYNPRIGHYLDLRDMNRVVTEGSANIYTPGYGRNTAFKPVNTTSSNTWTIAPGTCTEIYCSLAPGEKMKAGGDTKFIIKEVKTNAGTGTLGNYDLAIVGRDINGAPYATVMAQNYKVGDEIILQQHFVDPNYQLTDWANSAQQPQIMPSWENATSGNCMTMENGTILTSIIDAQAGYNNNVYARTLYGTNNDGTKLWIAVCGNKTSTYYGMTTTQMTYFLKYLGATYASQVDCGGSAQMYVDGSQVNKSTDSSNTRAVHSGIFVVATGDDTATGTPSLTSSASNTDFGNIAVGGAVEKTFTVTGDNLKGDITMSITGANASSFVVTPSTILKANQKGSITVKYAPTSGGSHSATLNIATDGAPTLTYNLTGKAEALAGASAVYQDDAAAYGVIAPDAYDLEVEYADVALADLAGKTVKRVIARGDILYILAHDAKNYPTILVYNHTTKQKISTLGVENAVIPGVDNTVGISDIAISADGSLVGTHYATQAFQQTGYGVTYKWLQNADGIAYGQPFHWNVHNNSGNWTNGYIGETIAMQGDWKTGKFVNTAQTTASTEKVRFTIQELGKVNEEGQIKSIYHNNLESVTGYTRIDLGDMLLFASPFNENNVILQGNKKAGAEFALAGTAAGVPTLVASVPSVIPAAANHTGIFRYGGKVYMTSATFSGNNSNGVMLVDITGGLASGKQVSLSQSAMSSSAGNVATVGTGVITKDGDKFVEARMAIIAVRDGKITKFITPSSIQAPEPDEPTLITTAADIDFGQVEMGKTAASSFTVEGYALEEDVTVTVSGNGFSATPTSFAKDDCNGTVTVVFSPTAEGEATGTLTIASKGVETVTINLKGTGVEEVVTAERGHTAYDLVSDDSDKEQVTLSFNLSGDVAGVRIIFTPREAAQGLSTYAATTADNGTYVYEIGALSAGNHEYTLDKADLPFNTLNWTVEVDNYPVAASTNVYQYNPNDGGNSKGGIGLIETGKLHGYLVASTGNAKGFTVLSPEYAPVGQQYDADYFSNHGAKPAWSSGNVSSPFRLAINNGIAYAIDYADAGAGIYIFNPEHPEYGTGNIFANGGSATKDSGGCWTLNGTALGGGGSGLCFTGSGADTRLWSFQQDYPAGNSNPQYVCSWNIGTSTTISMAPTKYDDLWGNGSNFSGKFLNTNVNLLADGNNGIFLSQNRAHADGGQSNALYYIDLNGKVIYDADDDGKPFGSSYAGMALNADRSIFALCCYSADGGINIYDVTWDGNKPSFTHRETIPGTAGVIGVQMTFDTAGNLVVYQQGSGINVYSIKNSKGLTTATPAVMTINATTTGVGNINIDNHDVAPVYYNLNGVRMPDGARLAPGVYLKVTGKKSEKVLIK